MNQNSRKKVVPCNRFCILDAEMVLDFFSVRLGKSKKQYLHAIPIKGIIELLS